MTSMTKGIILIGCIVIMIITGFLLHKTSRPYPTGIFTIHKLAALGAIVFSVFLLKGTLALSPFNMALIIVAIVAIIALFATGALLSIGKIDAKILQVIHLPASVIALGSLAALIFYSPK